MADYLVVAEALLGPSRSGGPDDAAPGVIGLAGALGAAGHKVKLLTLAPVERLQQTPGLARRLRTVEVSVGGRKQELPLFEGRMPGLAADVVALAGAPTRSSEATAMLGSGAATLARDGIVKPDVVVGWGESSASALATLPAGSRLFVLPTGRLSPALSADEIADLEETADVGAGASLAARAVMSANAVVVPSPTAGLTLSGEPALAARASDEPLVPLQFGCDEPPFDPASDGALAAPYSADAPQGKQESRRAVARRCSLSLGPRTLLLTTAPLVGAAGKDVLAALGQLVGLDVAVVVPGGGDRALADAAGVLAIEQPGRIAVLADESPQAARQLLAAADAVVLFEDAQETGRGAGVAQRYGALPIAPENGVFADFLVDCDPASGTGNALLVPGLGVFDLVGAVRRAIALRADAEDWSALVRRLMVGAPRWATFAERLELLREPAAAADLAAAE
jgi:hypothetical protein